MKRSVKSADAAGLSEDKIHTYIHTDRQTDIYFIGIHAQMYICVFTYIYIYINYYCNY